MTGSHSIAKEWYPAEISSIPTDLHSCLAVLERRSRKSDGSQGACAVFDLDGTLLSGDIGEAVYEELLRSGDGIGLGLEEYEKLFAVDRLRAYERMVSAMEGVQRSRLIQATRKIMTLGRLALQDDGRHFQFPWPRPEMRALVAYLHLKGYAVYVITASNQISARIVCREWFGIPEERVLGIRQRTEDGILTAQVYEPIPAGDGKRDVYKMFVGEAAPLITASDSLLDLPMLTLVDPDGLVVWVNDSLEDREVLRSSVPETVTTWTLFPGGRHATFRSPTPGI